MNLTIRLYQDEEAFTLLSNGEFEQNWIRLAGIDPRLSLSQKPAFVNPWYRVYAQTFSPVLIIGYDLEDSVVAIMPLAKNRSDGSLTHAGDHQAEYHGWIAHPAYSDTFIVESLKVIKSHFSLNSWAWRWMPPGTDPNKWDLDALKEAGIHVGFEERPAPLWDLTKTDKLKKTLKSKSLKSKINRYKRRGAYRFERITSKEQTAALMPVLADQVDFRKEAITRNRPFGDDPFKAQFYTALQDYPEGNHFSVLWLDDKPLAFHSGPVNGKVISLGLSAYDPSEGKQSPGTLLIVELAKMLVEEGYERLDLTPGTDAYKDRFATDYWNLYRPRFYFSSFARFRGELKANVISTTRNFLTKVGIGPARLRSMVLQLKSIPSQISREGASFIGKAIYKQVSFKRFSLRQNLIEPEISPSVKTQDYEYLMDNVPATVSRNSWLSDALRKFSNGEVVYSLPELEDDSVIGWRRPTRQPYELPNTDWSVDFPKGAWLLHSYTYQASSEPNLAGMVARMVADSFKDGGEAVYAVSSTRQSGLEKALTQLGFVAEETYTYRRLFGFIKFRSTQPV